MLIVVFDVAMISSRLIGRVTALRGLRRMFAERRGRGVECL